MTTGEELYKLGVAHRDGSNGNILSRAKAGENFAKAAELGHPGATAWIALLSKGTITGYDEDLEAYEKWSKAITEVNSVQFFIERAEQNDDVDASYTLGVLYEEALGVKLDYGISLKWYYG